MIFDWSIINRTIIEEIIEIKFILHIICAKYNHFFIDIPKMDVGQSVVIGLVDP